MAAGAVTALALFALPASAQAGRLIVTGHDSEHHCARDAATGRASCSYVGAAVNYVRGGAPDPNKPVLVLDRRATNADGTLQREDFRVSLERVLGGPIATTYAQFVDPRSPQFATLALTTANYSAILVASSKDDPGDATPQDLNENGSTPDTDAINNRAGDIAAFFDTGGGLFVNSGGAAARADSRTYYRFLNITRGGAAVTRPFSLTAVGRAIGFQDARQFPGEQNSINCCETHVSFEAPAPESPLKVAEQDAAGRAITMAADTPTLASIEEPVVAPGPIFGDLPGGGTGTGTGGGGSACVPRKKLRVSLRRPLGVRFARITVYVNGKKVRTVKGRKLGTKRRTRAFKVKLAANRTSKVRIVVRTASGRKLTYRKTYKPCR